MARLPFTLSEKSAFDVLTVNDAVLATLDHESLTEADFERAIATLEEIASAHFSFRPGRGRTPNATHKALRSIIEALTTLRAATK